MSAAVKCDRCPGMIIPEAARKIELSINRMTGKASHRFQRYELCPACTEVFRIAIRDVFPEDVLAHGDYE